MPFESIEGSPFDNEGPTKDSTLLDDMGPTEPKPEPELKPELKKGIEVIASFINSNLEDKFPFGIADIVGKTKEAREIFKREEEEYYEECERALKTRFRDKSFSEIKELLGDETIMLIEKVVSIYNRGMEEISDPNINIKKDIQELIEKQMLPNRFRQIL